MLSRLIAASLTPTSLGTFDSPSTVVTVSDFKNSPAAVTSKLEAIISEFLGLITVVAGVAVLFYFVTGALNWVSAGGDEGKIQKARDQMTQAVIGMVVIVAAYGIIGLVSNFLGLNLLNPGQAILNLIPKPSTTIPALP